MTSSSEFVDKLPAPLKWIGGVLVAAGAAVASVFSGHPVQVLALVLGGLAAVGLLVLGYVLVLRMVRGRQYVKLAPAFSSAFWKGFEKLRKAGFDPYHKPWYVLVGEPGAGKTEAIRHSSIPFPRGMNEKRQGEGGTKEMDWWFANDAILLDTAGRVMFEGGNEWTEFLRLLRKARPNQPINGMVLAIPSTSLLLDSAEQIREKAEKIAEQFDAIQRELEIRFPVFVLVTKADKITGFREYFYNLSDPAAQNQVLGWSNPKPLDEPFRPEMVQEYLGEVRTQLKRRRMALLRDPKVVEERSNRRIDQLDALYAFPDALAKIGSRLRVYLETIFTPNEYSGKPLFVRGIYFTSAMREGTVLDEDLAEAFNISPEQVPPTLRIWEKERSYFLKDVFEKKVFQEWGLVMRPNGTVSGQVYRRRLAMLATSAVAAMLVIGFTVYGFLENNRTIGDAANFWRTVHDNLQKDPDLKWARVLVDEKGDVKYQRDAVPIQQQNAELFAKDVKPHPVLGVWSSLDKSLQEERPRAHQRLFELGVLEPSIAESQRRLANRPIDRQLTDEESLALQQLLLMGAQGEKRQGLPEVEPDLKSIVLVAAADPNSAQIATLGASAQIWFKTLFPAGDGATWPQTTAFNPQTVANAISRLQDGDQQNETREIDPLVRLVKQVTAYKNAETTFLTPLAASGSGGLPFDPTDEGFDQLKRHWDVSSLSNAADDLGKTAHGVKDLRTNGLAGTLSQLEYRHKTLVKRLTELQRFVGRGSSNSHLGKIANDLKCEEWDNQFNGRLKDVRDADLQTLGSFFLSPVAGEGPKWGFEQRLKLYRDVAALLASRDGDPNPMTQQIAGLGDFELAKKAARACQIALAFRDADARSRQLAAEIQNWSIPAVTASQPGSERVGPIPLTGAAGGIAVPSGLETQKAGGAFQSAQRALEKWNHRSEGVAPGLPALLNEPQLTLAFDDKQKQFDSYRKQYDQYWNEEFGDKLKVKPATWQEVGNQLNGADAAKVDGELVHAATLMQQAAKSAGRAPTAVQSSDHPEFQTLLEGWQELLAKNPRQAREALLKKTADNVNLLFVAKSTDRVGAYWNAVSEVALTALSNECNTALGDIFRQLVDECRFPLDLSSGQDMTPDRLGRVGMLLAELNLKPAAGSDPRLQRLCAAHLSPADQTRADEIVNRFKFIRQGASCDISTASDANLIWQQVALEKERGKGAKQQPIAGKVLGTLNIADGPASLSFYQDFESADPAKSIDLSGESGTSSQWPLLRLLNKAQSSSGDGTTWQVTINIEEIAGRKAKPLTLKLKFNRDMRSMRSR